MSSVLTTLRRSVGLSPQKPKTTLTSNAKASGSSPKKSATSDKGPVHGYLILESSKGIEKERFPLQKRITTVGRLHHCDIRVYDETVSRLHCQICVDDNGKIFLQIFNVRGLRLNQQKIQSLITSDGDKCLELQESDLIEIFTHRFRLEHVARDKHGGAIVPPNARLGRKSLRMSLVRAAVNDGGASLQESQAALEEVEEDNEKKEEPRVNRTFPEQDKENAPIKGRRSFTLDTPNRSSTRNGPWETEPRKKKVKRLSLSPIKGASLIKSTVDSRTDLETSIVVMEEVDDVEVEEEPQPVVEEEVEDSAEESQPESIAERPLATPARETSSSLQRLTQSSSPKKPTKKARRRSSFFGRAGIFAGLNLGFYPEERRENAEEKAVEVDVKESASPSPLTSPDRLQKIATPEPRLDHYGMPRLPRSMSSPSGLNYGSPGKRRVISLRTATLIRTGQKTFEERKLLSPPVSPTKTFSSPSLLAPFVSSSPDKKAAAGQIPLPDSDDEEDADEVDRSLSSFLDDDEEDKPLPQPRFDLSKPRTINGPRKSHAVSASYSFDAKAKSKGKGRISLPGKLLSVTLVEKSNDKALEGWRKEWEKDAKAGEESRDKDNSGLEAALNNAFNKAQDEDTDEEKEVDAMEDKEATSQDNNAIELGNATHLKEERSPLKMLRHMVRDNSELTALLNEITGDGAVQDEQTNDNKEKAKETTTASCSAVEETMEEAKIVREIPEELTSEAAAKLSRRMSELPQKKTKRLSSIAQKTLPRKSRKSAGAVLHTKEDASIPSSKMPSKVVEVVDVDVADVPATTPLAEDVMEKGVPEMQVELEKPETVLQESPLKRSPRKRAVEAVKAETPAVNRQTRGAKLIEVNADEASGSKQRTSSRSPQKKGTGRGKNALSSLRGYSDEIDSDDLHSSRLVLEPSSPIKRTKRAAKEQAETKIRNVLVKKPSIAVMRDARSLSETMNKSSKPSDEIRAKMTTRAASQLPRKAANKAIEVVHSEPTRTTRSRAAAKR